MKSCHKEKLHIAGHDWNNLIMGVFKFYLVLATCLLLSLTVLGRDSEPTVTTERLVSLERGSKGLLPCQFERAIYAVQWSKGPNPSAAKLLVVYDTIGDAWRRWGPGLDNGIYNITADFSLIVKHVELQHKDRFFCEVTDAKTSDHYMNHTDVTVTVPPKQPLPFIEECQDAYGQNCTVFTSSPTNVTCSAFFYFPDITLFFIHNSTRVNTQSSEFNNTDGTKNKSVTITSAPNSFPYICVASNIPGSDDREMVAFIYVMPSSLERTTEKVKPKATPTDIKDENDAGPKLVIILPIVFSAALILVISFWVLKVIKKRRGGTTQRQAPGENVILLEGIEQRPAAVESETLLEDPTKTAEAKMIRQLKKFYKLRCRVTVIPWTDRSRNFESVGINDVFIHPELKACVTKPYVPVSYAVTMDNLFSFEPMETEHTRAILRGTAGSGKTTLLLKLCNDWADGKSEFLKDDKAVFFLPMSTLDFRSNLGDAIRKHFFPHSVFSVDFIENFVLSNQEKITILLDGFDEFKLQTEEHNENGNVIGMLKGNYIPDVRLLVTTRQGNIKDFRELVGKNYHDYLQLDTSGFSSSSFDNYIDKFLKERKDKVLLKKRLLDYLIEHDLKMELACLPLMCCAFCQLTKWTDGKDFKDMKTLNSLLDKLMKCLLEYHPMTKDAKPLDIRGSGIVANLGRVALEAFMGSPQSEMILSENNFDICQSGNDLITQGCEMGILFQETDYGAVNYEQSPTDLGEVIMSRSFRFVLKIFQEKLAGMYLAKLITELDLALKDKLEKFKNFKLQRVMDFRNILMFACGNSKLVAKFIIPVVVGRFLSEIEDNNLELFWKGKLHYEKSVLIQQVIEFCLQLNFESQSEGGADEVLKPLFTECKRFRFVEISRASARYLNYFLAHTTMSLKSLELIRLHSDSEYAVRLCTATLHGLKEDLAKSMISVGEKDTPEKSIPERERRQKMWEKVSEDNNIPTNFLMHVPDKFFLACLPLWEKLYCGRTNTEGDILELVIDGINKHAIDELVLNGLPVDQDVCSKLCKYFTDQNFKSLEKLTVANSFIGEESIKDILSSLNSQPQLSHLDLSRNKLANVVETLGQTLHLEKLNTLVLQDATMTTSSMQHLGKLLPRCSSLRILDIRMNECTDDETIFNIYNGLTHCVKLERLLISLYRVTKQGLEYIYERSSQRPYSMLKELQLIHSPTPESLLVCVAGFLSCMTNIEELWLSGLLPTQEQNLKCISYDAATKFANAVTHCPPLQTVGLQFVKFDAKSFIDFLDKCQEASNLEKLWFSHNYIPAEHVEKAHTTNLLRVWV